MMASLNSVTLLGNLTRPPEMRYTPNGTAVCNFGLAINRRYKQGEDYKEEVCYVDIVSFGRQAETVAEYLDKGSLAMIEGRLQWRSWETPEGQKRSKHEVVANNVQFMPRGQTPDPSHSVPSTESGPPMNPMANNAGNRNTAPGDYSAPATAQPGSDGLFPSNDSGYGDNDDIPF